MSFDLSAVPTCELVDEFKKREGVWATSVEPYEKKIFNYRRWRDIQG